MQKIVFLCCILWCIAPKIKAQECNLTLKGKVSDFHDKSLISGASIHIINSSKYTTTNWDGLFEFSNLCSGKYMLEIRHIACETRKITINLTKNMFEEISLEHHLEELNEVVVATNTKETKTAQETVLKAATLEKFSSLSLGDALKEVSGVSAINTGSTIVKPIINGLHSSRIIIMNNGVRQQDQEWGIEHAPNIDINSANQISVIKGAGALAYGGDAIGGVVVMNPKKIVRKDTLFGKTIFGWQTNGRGYNIASNLNKNYSSGWFAQLQGSYKRNGDFNAPDYNLTNTGLDSKGISARFGKQKFESGFEVFYSYVDNEIGILGTAHIGSVFDLRRAINSGQPFLVNDFSYQINVPKQEITHHLLKTNYYKRFQNFGKVQLQYDYQHNRRKEFDIRIGDRRNTPAIDLLLQTHTFATDITIDSNLSRKLNIGILGRFQNNFANPDTGVRRLIPDYDKYDFGFYSTSEWKVNNNLTVDAGIRYDFNRIDAKKFYRKSRWQALGYDIDFSDIIIRETPTQFLTNPVFNYHNISASVGAKFHLNEKSYFIANYALASRPPNPSELFSDGLHHSSARFELGDLRFSKEISNRISASYYYNTTKFNFTTELFYNSIKDYIFLRPVDLVPTNRGPFPIWNYQQTNATLYGIDINATYAFTDNWQWQNKTAYLRGNDVDANQPLIHIPPFNTINKITYTNTSWYNFTASLQSEWVFEQNQFPDFNFDIVDALSGETFKIDISTPPPAFHLLHFYSKATFNVGKKTTLDVALGVNNLLDTSYRNYLNQLRFFADELGRNVTLQVQLNY